MEAALLVVVAVASALVWTGWTIGYRMGVKYAVQETAEAVLRDTTLEAGDSRLANVRKLVKAPYQKLVNGGIFEIGRNLGMIVECSGMETRRRMRTPEAEEAEVVMNREELKDVAWLADYGLRVWSSEEENGFRFGERLPYDRAEKIAYSIEALERKVASWPTEPEEEKERRFDRAQNRLQRLWDVYPDRPGGVR